MGEGKIHKIPVYVGHIEELPDGRVLMGEKCIGQLIRVALHGETMNPLATRLPEGLDAERLSLDPLLLGRAGYKTMERLLKGERIVYEEWVWQREAAAAKLREQFFLYADLGREPPANLVKYIADMLRTPQQRKRGRPRSNDPLETALLRAFVEGVKHRIRVERDQSAGPRGSAYVEALEYVAGLIGISPDTLDKRRYPRRRRQ